MLNVFKMNDYEWYVTPWDKEKTIEWYKKEFCEDCDIEDEVEECDIDKQGMWYPTNDEEDIKRLGDLHEIVSTETIENGRIVIKTKFGDLIRCSDCVYKFVSYREVIEKDYIEELKEPEVIVSTDW